MCEQPNMLDPAVREEIRATVHAAMTEFMTTMMGQAMAMRAGMGMPQMPAGMKPPAAPMQPPAAPMQPPAVMPVQAPMQPAAQDQNAGERPTEQLVGDNGKPTHGDISLDFVIPNVLPLERPRKIGGRKFYFFQNTEPEPNRGDRANFVAPTGAGIAQPQKTKSGCEFKPTPSA